MVIFRAKDKQRKDKGHMNSKKETFKDKLQVSMNLNLGKSEIDLINFNVCQVVIIGVVSNYLFLCHSILYIYYFDWWLP